MAHIIKDNKFKPIGYCSSRACCGWRDFHNGKLKQKLTHSGDQCPDCGSYLLFKRGMMRMSKDKGVVKYGVN